MPDEIESTGINLGDLSRKQRNSTELGCDLVGPKALRMHSLSRPLPGDETLSIPAVCCIAGQTWVSARVERQFAPVPAVLHKRVPSTGRSIARGLSFALITVIMGPRLSVGSEPSLWRAVRWRWLMDASKQADLATLGQSVEALKRGLGDRLVAVVLFGSRARGEAREDSDWDLLVLARDLPARLFQRHRVLKQMLPAAERGRLSLLAKTPQEFEASLPALYLDIALDGIVLYDQELYIADKLVALRQLIGKKGLHRERSGRDLVWSWQEFPGFGWAVEWERART